MFSAVQSYMFFAAGALCLIPGGMLFAVKILLKSCDFDKLWYVVIYSHFGIIYFILYNIYIMYKIWFRISIERESA